LWYLLRQGIAVVEPEIPKCLGICLSLIGIAMLMSIVDCLPGQSKKVTGLCGSIVIGCLMLGPSTALIQSAADTVRSVSDYGKLLIPVLTAALAARGGASESAALYAGTMFFDTILTSVIANAIVPMVYIFMALSIAKGALGNDILKRLQDLIKSTTSWFLKLVLYVFTGYMTITKVITGTADQTALKATKLTISGMVPVVGGMLSDASETVLISAGIVRNSVGIAGLMAVLAISVGPFLKIGVQYLMLKMTAAVCNIFADKRTTTLIGDFTTAMGLILGMTGTVCLLQIISIVCFLMGAA
jgi:stage III sporulation protein AE